MTGVGRWVKNRTMIEFGGKSVWCLGHDGGLPVFGWNEAPIGLVTRNQLAEQDLTPGRRADVVAILRFHTRWGLTDADLFWIEQAEPKPPDTPARAAARVKAEKVLRWCHTCHQQVDHRVRGPKKQCSTCFALDEAAA